MVVTVDMKGRVGTVGMVCLINTVGRVSLVATGTVRQVDKVSMISHRNILSPVRSMLHSHLRDQWALTRIY